MNQHSENTVEDVLRVELAEGDAVIGTLGPILRHLLVTDDQSLFSDETIARARGMVESLARQLLCAQAKAANAEVPEDFVDVRLPALTNALLQNTALLGHIHALTIEWQLTEQLRVRNGVDPVLSPLLQALIASSDPNTATAAMAALSAQARFVQSLRRMELSLTELPGDLFHVALLTLADLADDADVQSEQAAENALRAVFDESRTRIGLFARLVTGMGSGAIAALSANHAGAAIFLSSLSLGARQERDLTIYSTNPRQLARLVLALRASGLSPKAVEEQILCLHPDLGVPAGVGDIRTDRAAALLAAGAPYPGAAP